MEGGGDTYFMGLILHLSQVALIKLLSGSMHLMSEPQL